MIKTVPSRDARRALLAKGFAAAEGRARDHEFYFFYLDGKKTSAFMKISHGAPDVRRDEIRNTARAWRLGGDDLYRILSCEHDAEKTRELIQATFAE